MRSASSTASVSATNPSSSRRRPSLRLAERPATSGCWLIESGGDVALLTCDPPRAAADVQALHPGAAVRALSRDEWLRLPPPASVPTTGCRSCLHLSAPGLSDGYCGSPLRRDDLLPAYGPQHPLRQLPPDRGETCCGWQPDGVPRD